MDLLEGALLVASMERPDLSTEVQQRRLDELAAAVRPRVAPGAPAPETLTALLDVLYRELGFRGNTGDYYDPDNSLLDAVLARRTGIPISLAVVLVAVAARLGTRLEGVPFPGHFLVRCVGPSSALFVDPFVGRLIERDELLAFARRAFGRDVPLRPIWLEPASPRMVLFRMLTNLRAIYAQRGDRERLARVVERLVLLSPTDELRAELERLGGSTLWPSGPVASA